MAGEYNEKFEILTGLAEKVVGRVDEMRLEMRDMRIDLGENTRRLGSVENRLGLVDLKLDLLSAQFTDVAGVVIRDHHPRINSLENRVEVLETEAH